MTLNKNVETKEKESPVIVSKYSKNEWSEVKKYLTPAPDMIVFRIYDKTDSGIILPNGNTLLNNDEYRPMAELCGENVTFISPGDTMILHPNAKDSAIPFKFGGFIVFMINHQFVLGKSTF